MKKFSILCLLSFTILGCASSIKIPSSTTESSFISQEEREKIREAIELHDKGDYEGAINIYKEVLKNNPGNTMALYEISYSLFMAQKYDQGLEYALKGLEYKSEFECGLHIIAGNNLDEMGKNEDAISVYEKGIEQFPDEYLLHYNMGLSYLNLSDPENAEKSMIKAIECNHNHSSSYMALGEIYKGQGKQIPSLLLFLRFLILEPDSKRSESALVYIDQLVNWGVEKKDDKHINISMANIDENSPYSTLELILKLKKASAYAEENKNKSAVKLRVEELQDLISVIGEHENVNSGDFTANHLFPYFAELKKSENAEVFTYYIHQSADNEEINNWLKENQDKVKNFLGWDRNYEWKKD